METYPLSPGYEEAMKLSLASYILELLLFKLAVPLPASLHWGLFT